MTGIKFHDEAVRAQLDGMRRRAERIGVDDLAKTIASRLQENTDRAFAQKVDPGTGRAWDPAAAGTQASRGYKSLLERTGQLKAATRASTQKGTTGSAFARIALDSGSTSILMRGLVQHYGIQARAKRSNRAQRKNAKFSLPARRFTGLSRSDIAEFLRDAERMITGA